MSMRYGLVFVLALLLSGAVRGVGDPPVAKPTKPSAGQAYAAGALASVRKDPAALARAGLSKLTEAECGELERLLQTAFDAGFEAGARQALAVLTPEREPALGSVFDSKIDEASDDVLKLRNGAVVHVTRGYVGYIGFGRDCCLFKPSGHKTWRIWVANKKSFPCEVWKEPVESVRRRRTVREATVTEVKGAGAILRFDDSALFEVDEYDRFTTSMWIAPLSVLVLDDEELLDLDGGGDRVRAIKIR
jgi:hypothetical protein